MKTARTVVASKTPDKAPAQALTPAQAKGEKIVRQLSEILARRARAY